MPYDKQREGSFSEYRRLIFRMLEEGKEDHDEFKRDINKELRELKEEIQRVKESCSELKTTFNQTKFKLNLWYAFLASLPGWIALAFAVFRSK